MTNLKTDPPLTVIYRGTLKDTAVLIGLAQMRVNVGRIIFMGNVTPDFRKYCQTLSRWLAARGLPDVRIQPAIADQDLERVLNCPLKDWGWGEQECIAAIHLSGLPIPPLVNAA